jgi:hypothetical protein
MSMADAVRGTLSLTPKIGAMRTASIRAPAKPDIDWKIDEKRAASAARKNARKVNSMYI